MDSVTVAFLILLASVALTRLAEVVVCRYSGADSVSRESIFPLMVMVHILLLGGTLAEVLLMGRPFLPWIGFPMGIVLLSAQVLRIWIYRSLGHSWHIRVLRPERVVGTGPYRYVRHPNYLAVVLEFLSLPLLHSAYLTSLCCSVANALVLRSRIRTEEKLLMSIPEYRREMVGKPRFLPRLTSSYSLFSR